MDHHAPHPEYVYLDLLKHILDHGSSREDRTGTGTRSLFAQQLRFDISNSVPILTTKFVPTKAVLKELLWFLKGSTDANTLKEQGVRIWDGNTTREFLDQRGLSHLPEGDIGAGYGFQWRHFGAQYNTCKDDYRNEGFDQIQYILEQLRTDPFSRRIFMSAWNPHAMKDMALPPCHVSCQFYVDEHPISKQKQLSCHMYQRSVDCFLGLPFNIFSYAALTYLLATMTDMVAKELVISTGDTHIYNNHVSQVTEQLARKPYPWPTLKIHPSVKSKTVDEVTLEDFEISGYTYHPTIKAPMSV